MLSTSADLTQVMPNRSHYCTIGTKLAARKPLAISLLMWHPWRTTPPATFFYNLSRIRHL